MAVSTFRSFVRVPGVVAGIKRSFSRSTTDGGRQGVEEGGRSQAKKLLLLIIPVSTFGLGTWQVQRLKWKKSLIADLERRTMEPPIPMPANIADRLKELEYRRVTLTGHFDHAHEIHMWPRGRNISQDEKPSSINQTSEPGAHVITPFYCNETKSFILVNRGWVPKNRMNPETRQEGQIKGEIVLNALVRTQEKRQPFSPKNNPEHNRWSWRDVDSMAQLLNTDPVMMDADATTSVPGGPEGGQTRVSLRNEHLQYIMTWYSLSLITFYMFWKFWTKGRRR